MKKNMKTLNYKKAKVNVIRETVSINFWPSIVKNPKFGRNLEVSVEAYENDETILQKEKIDPSIYMEPYISLYKEYEEGLDNPEHNFTDTETSERSRKHCSKSFAFRDS